MAKDEAFMKTQYANELKWLKDDRESIFDPDYNDILRIAFMYKFDHAKLKDLVSLLVGRDFLISEPSEMFRSVNFCFLSLLKRSEV